MKIILDTNILISDFQFCSQAFIVFLKGFDKLPAELYIPQIVLDELIYNFKEKLIELNNQYSSLQKEFIKITGKKGFNYIFNIESMINEYKSKVDKFINDYNVKVIDYPKISLRDITIRDLEKKKPFKKNGSGYRDFIIWECLKSEVKSWGGDTVVFISNNSRDFGVAPNLDKCLEEEIKNEIHKFKYYNSLNDFNNDMILPRLKTIESLLGKFNDKKIYDFDLYKWLLDHLKDIIYDNEIGQSILGFDGYGRVCPVSVDEIKEIEILNLKEFSEKDILISFSVKSEVIFSVDADWGDFCECKNIRDFFGEDTEPFSWISTYHKDTLTIFYSIIYSLEEKEVWSEELDGFSNYFTTVYFNEIFSKK